MTTSKIGLYNKDFYCILPEDSVFTEVVCSDSYIVYFYFQRHRFEKELSITATDMEKVPLFTVETFEAPPVYEKINLDNEAPPLPEKVDLNNVV